MDKFGNLPNLLWSWASDKAEFESRPIRLILKPRHATPWGLKNLIKIMDLSIVSKD